MNNITKTLDVMTNNTVISAEFNSTKSELRMMFKRDLNLICAALDREAAQELYNFLGLALKRLPSPIYDNALDNSFLEEEKVS